MMRRLFQSREAYLLCDLVDALSSLQWTGRDKCKAVRLTRRRRCGTCDLSHVDVACSEKGGWPALAVVTGLQSGMATRHGHGWRAGPPPVLVVTPPARRSSGAAPPSALPAGPAERGRGSRAPGLMTDAQADQREGGAAAERGGRRAERG